MTGDIWVTIVVLFSSKVRLSFLTEIVIIVIGSNVTALSPVVSCRPGLICIASPLRSIYLNN